MTYDHIDDLTLGMMTYDYTDDVTLGLMTYDYTDDVTLGVMTYNYTDEVTPVFGRYRQKNQQSKAIFYYIAFGGQHWKPETLPQNK